MIHWEKPVKQFQILLTKARRNAAMVNQYPIAQPKIVALPSKHEHWHLSDHVDLLQTQLEGIKALQRVVPNLAK